MLNASNILLKINLPSDISVPEFFSINVASLFDTPYVIFNDPAITPNQFRNSVILLNDLQTLKYFFNRSSAVWQVTNAVDVLFLTLKNLITSEDNQVTMVIQRGDPQCRPTNTLQSSVQLAKTMACNFDYSINVQDEPQYLNGTFPAGINNTVANSIVCTDNSIPAYNVQVQHYASRNLVDYFNTYQYTLLDSNGQKGIDTIIEIGSGSGDFTARPFTVHLNNEVPSALVIDARLFNNYIPFHVTDLVSLRADAGNVRTITSGDLLKNKTDYNKDFNIDFVPSGISLFNNYEPDFNKDFSWDYERYILLKYLSYDSIVGASFNSDFSYDFDRNKSSLIIFDFDNSKGFWNSPNAEAVIFYTVQFKGRRSSSYLLIQKS